MRQIIRRLRTCEAGAGTIEYALLIAVLALCLVGVLGIFRNAVGGLTNRTAVTVSRQAAGGYGRGGSVGMGSSGGTVAHEPAPADPDSSSTQPDSPSATGGSTVASSNPPIP